LLKRFGSAGESYIECHTFFYDLIVFELMHFLLPANAPGSPAGGDST
jgi:hypothetical protein